MSGDVRHRDEPTSAMAVRSRNTTVAWYAEVVVFELLDDAEEMDWCELNSPAAAVSIGLSEVGQPEVRRGTTLVFRGEDHVAARDAIESKDASFDGDTMTMEGMVRLATRPATERGWQRAADHDWCVSTVDDGDDCCSSALSAISCPAAATTNGKPVIARNARRNSRPMPTYDSSK